MFRVALSALTLCLLSACTGDADEPVDPRLQTPLLRANQFDQTAPDLFRARFETTSGVFVIAVHREWAPLGADRFYNLVERGWYDGVRFHRVLEDFTASWGIHDNPSFEELSDHATGRTRIRVVNVQSEHYSVAREYMIRLERRDLEDRAMLMKLAEAAKMAPEEFGKKFAPLVGLTRR